MSAVTTLSIKNDFNTTSNLRFGLGSRKTYRNDPMFAYHTIECTASDTPSDEHGKQMQLVISNTELPISYAGNGGILVRLKRGSELHMVLRDIEAKVRASAPPGLCVAPLVKEPDNQQWDPSFKLKSDWCAVHTDSTGTLEQGCVLKRCLFSMGRLNHYQGKYHWGCVLKSALIGDTPSEEFGHDREAMAQESLDLLDE